MSRGRSNEARVGRGGENGTYLLHLCFNFPELYFSSLHELGGGGLKPRYLLLRCDFGELSFHV